MYVGMKSNSIFLFYQFPLVFMAQIAEMNQLFPKILLILVFEITENSEIYFY